jgi:hypothetical protein
MPETISGKQLDTLEAKCRKASRGKWFAVKSSDGMEIAAGHVLENRPGLCRMAPGGVWVLELSDLNDNWRNDRAFIVAAQPDTVLSLIARIRELEAEAAPQGIPATERG